MHIIIGLGNLGKVYKNTRHNSGFIIVDGIKKAYKFPDFKLNKDFHAEISRDKNVLLGNIDTMLVKPQTFMNESGQAVRELIDYYKFSPEDIIVIHDDLDLPLGEYKIATDSRSAGHKGVESIIDALGTQKFKRIRIGIFNPELKIKIPAEDFVLQKFSEEELNTLTGSVSGDILFEIEKLLKQKNLP